ncbi:MAG: xcpSH [Halothiobacillaceae bacterium]|nr:MAG: xcpSH [Halothiobacillaceae bacterium]
MAAAVGIVLVLLAYVVPQVVQVFDNMGQQLPLLTRALISLSAAIRECGLIAIGAIVAGIFLFRAAIKREGPRKNYHRLILRLPLIGRLARGLNAARFARTFSILIASGVPVLEGLRISASVLSNLPMRLAVDDAANMVREGSSIQRALEQSRYFPPMTIHLIASGESSGNLEGMLERAAGSQEREVETLIAAMMGIFEPVLLLVMGGVVLMIVLAILMPIFEMNQLVR